MRILEIVLLLIITILPIIKRRLALKVQAQYLLITLGALITLHLFIEGWRWQMIPAYFLTIVLAWRIQVVDVTQSVKLSFIRIIGYLGILILIIFGWLLPTVLPVFTLPEPQGEYKVGTESRYVQTDREETITEDPNDKRELLYKIWYPSQAEVSEALRDEYLDPAGRSGFATKYGLPPNALNYLKKVNTHVYQSVPIAKGTFPVLIFSHGYGSNATGYYALLTELASHGYIIINMNHTYESLGATFPDGRAAYFDFEFQRKISSGSMEVAEPLIKAFKDDLSYEERHPIVKKAVMNFFESKSMDRWATDMIETIDLLENWNTNGTLAGSMNLEKVGVFGHSNGGGSAGIVPLMDQRVKAAVNIDGISWGNVIDTTYQIPFLYVSADWPAEHEDINSHVYINKSTDYFYETKLVQSGHPNFMDIPFMIPVPAVAGTGSIDPYVGIEIVTRLVTTFFDRHLKDDPNASPERIDEQYDLLEMTIHKGDSIE